MSKTYLPLLSDNRRNPCAVPRRRRPKHQKVPSPRAARRLFIFSTRQNGVEPASAFIFRILRFAFALFCPAREQRATCKKAKKRDQDLRVADLDLDDQERQEKTEQNHGKKEKGTFPAAPENEEKTDARERLDPQHAAARKERKDLPAEMLVGFSLVGDHLPGILVIADHRLRFVGKQLRPVFGRPKTRRGNGPGQQGSLVRILPLVKQERGVLDAPVPLGFGVHPDRDLIGKRPGADRPLHQSFAEQDGVRRPDHAEVPGKKEQAAKKDRPRAAERPLPFSEEQNEPIRPVAERGDQHDRHLGTEELRERDHRSAEQPPQPRAADPGTEEEIQARRCQEGRDMLAALDRNKEEIEGVERQQGRRQQGAAPIPGQRERDPVEKGAGPRGGARVDDLKRERGSAEQTQSKRLVDDPRHQVGKNRGIIRRDLCGIQNALRQLQGFRKIGDRRNGPDVQHKKPHRKGKQKRHEPSEAPPPRDPRNGERERRQKRGDEQRPNVPAGVRGDAEAPVKQKIDDQPVNANADKPVRKDRRSFPECWIHISLLAAGFWQKPLKPALSPQPAVRLVKAVK